MPDNSWKRFFAEWPADMPRRGVLVTSFAEQIPFVGFLTGEGLLMIERSTPDAVGARSVLLGYEQVVAVKFTDLTKPKALRAAGFQGELSKQ